MISKERLEEITKCLMSEERDDVIEMFNDLKSKKSISVPLSEEDLEQLQNGEEFNWNFNGVDVKLFKGEEE